MMSVCVLIHVFQVFVFFLVRVEQPPLSSGDAGQSPWQLWLHRGEPPPQAEVWRDGLKPDRPRDYIRLSYTYTLERYTPTVVFELPEYSSRHLLHNVLQNI